jgi:pyruvate,water dikinase
METGGYLSHGAIVAREYGIPAVLNVPLATQRIPDGSSVMLDGAQGVVQVLPPV